MSKWKDIDDRLKVLMLLFFAAKIKDGITSSRDTYNVIGLSQNAISQYIHGKCKMPRASQIAMAQYVKESFRSRKPTYKYLDSLDVSALDKKEVKDMIDYIREHGRLNIQRGRTETIAELLLDFYDRLTQSRQ